MSDRTPEEHARLVARWRQSVAEYDQVARAADDALMDVIVKAKSELTFSGRLRTAIHRSPLTLAALIHQARVDRAVLQAFLIGDGDLPSSAIDRLVETLRIEVAMFPASREGE